MHLEKPLALVADRAGGTTTDRANLKGFVQELAVRADDEEKARALVSTHVAGYDLGPDQKIEVVFIEIAEVEADEAPPDALGVWFTTGRSFYSEE